MLDLTGKRVLLTGATGGLGEEILRKLHNQGAKIAISGTREEKLQNLVDSLKERVYACPCNLSDLHAVSALAKQAAEKLDGSIDIFISNAGITKDGLLMRMKEEDWQTVLNVNLTSYFILAKSLLRSMMKQKYGRIIGISSIVGVSGNPGQANYAASKAGMIGFAKSLAKEVANRGITVNTIAPGFIKSPMTDQLNETQQEQILQQIPMTRIGDAKDVAHAVLYLASKEASYITGQTLHVNGGMLMV